MSPDTQADGLTGAAVRLRDAPQPVLGGPAREEPTAQPATYFERPGPIAITFGAFFFVALPLFALRYAPNDQAVLPYLLLFEAVGLGTSHFFLTLAVYLDTANLRYFASSWRRRLIYFGMPALILIALALQEAVRLRETQPAVTAYLFYGLRFFDFFHVGRQSAGILRLFKLPLRSELPAWTRGAENAFFVGMGLMQWETFLLGGQFAGDKVYASLPAAMLALLFAATCVQYVPLLADARLRRPVAIALGYFVIQALCAAVAVYATWLYVTVLAVHYAEYHVIMSRRLFAGAPEQRSRGLRSPWLLYAGLAVLVCTFEARNYVITQSPSLTFFVHIFDGIFLLHYAVDAFLWRFSEPHWRDALGPQYFQPDPPAVPRERRRLQPVATGWAALAVGALLVVGWLAELPRRIESSVLAPLVADEHVRWAIGLANERDLLGAKHHLERAAELRPDDRRTRQWLETISKYTIQSLPKANSPGRNTGP